MPVILKVLLLALVLAGQAFAGITTTTWNGLAGNGLWSDPGNWDNGVPGNGPFSIPDAVIPGGPAIVVTLDIDTSSATFAINHLAIGAGATLILAPGGNLGIPVVILGQDAVINLTGGSISHADVQPNGTVTATILASNAGTNLNSLDSVTIESGITLDLGQQQGAFCTILNSLTVNGQVQIGSVDGTTSGSLLCSSNVTLGGTGFITFGGSPLNAITGIGNGTPSLTIGPSLTVEAVNSAQGTITVTGTLTNNGTLSASTSGSLQITANWINTGTIQALSNGAMKIYNLGSGANGANGGPGLLTETGAFLSIGGIGTWTNFIVTFPSGELDYHGNITASAGTLDLGGNWINLHLPMGSPGPTQVWGNVSIANGATLNLGGTFTAADSQVASTVSSNLPILSDGSCFIAITGTMDNRSNVKLIPYDDGTTPGPTFPTWTLQGGTILGGTVTSLLSGQALVAGASGALSGVTLDCASFGSTVLDLSQQGAGAQTTILNGLTFTNGALVLLGSDTANQGILQWTGSQTWSGSGEILFGSNGANAITEVPVAQGGEASETLTIGSQLTIDGEAGSITFANTGSQLVNQGTIDSDGGGTLTLNLQSWVNTGTLEATNFSTLDINTADYGVNTLGGGPIQGTITANGVGTNVAFGGNGQVVDQTPYSAGDGGPVGGISGVDGGTLYLGSSWSSTVTGQTPGIVVDSASTLYLSGSFTTAQALAIGGINQLTYVYVTGNMDNSNATLVLDGSTAIWMLLGGGISNGTISCAGANALLCTQSGGYLSNVAFTGSGTVLDLASNNNAQCTIYNGLNLGAGSVVAIGSVSGSMTGTLSWNGGQSWFGAGTILFGKSGVNAIADATLYNSDAGIQTLFLDVGLSVTGGGSASVTTAANDNMLIEAPISVPSGAGLTITGGTWTNVSTLTAAAGSTVTLGGSWSNFSEGTGTMNNSTTSFFLGGSFSSNELAGNTLQAPNPCTYTISGTMDGGVGSIIDLSLGNSVIQPTWHLNGGTIVNGILSDNGNGSFPSLVVVGAVNNVLNGVAIGTDPTDTVVLDLTNAGAGCTVQGGLNVNTWAAVGGSDGQAASLTWSGTQSWGGAGYIAFGSSSANAIIDGNASGSNILSFASPLIVCAGTGSIHADAVGSALFSQGTIITEYSPDGNQPLSSDLSGTSGALTVNLGAANTFTNDGLILVTAGASVQVDGNYIQSDQIDGGGGGTLWVSTGVAKVTTTPSLPFTGANALNITGNATIGGTFVLDWIGANPPTQGDYILLSAAGTLSIDQALTETGLAAPDFTLDTTDFASFVALAVTQPTVAVAPTSLTVTNQASQLSFEVAFSTAVLPALAPSMLTVTNGTVSAGQITTGSLANSYTVLVTPAGTSPFQETVTLAVNAGVASDSAGLFNLASPTPAAITYDTVAPTVAITPNGTITSLAPTFTLTFSKPVALTAAGLATNGTLGALSGGPLVWTVPVTPAGQGSVSLTVLAPPSPNAVVDLAGNPLAAAVTATVTYDTTHPAVVSFTPSGTSTNVTPIPFTITFTEAVSLNASGVTVTNGTLTAISPGPSSSYILEVTPNPSTPPETVTVAVAGTAVVDLAGNAMAGPATTAVTFDNAPLTTVITPNGTTQASGPVNFTVTFGSSLAAALTLGEVAITNGTASAVTTVSSSVSTIAVTPVAPGAVFLQIAGGVVFDAFGNANQPAIAVVNFSTNAPSAVVTPVSGTAALSPVVFTVTFSTAVSGLSYLGLASNAAIGAITPVGGGGTTYTVSVAPSVFGPVTLQVLAGAAVNGSDIGNTASNIGSIDYTVVTASTPVTVTVLPASPTANTSPLVFTLSFSVPVSGLTINDLVVTNGTASNLQGSGSSYTVSVTPSGDGPVSVAVLPNVATDSAGTANLASPPATVIYHATPPAAALAFAAAVPVTLASFPLSIAFSEPVTGFTANALSISNGAASAFTAIDAATYSVTITPTQPVTASVIATIPAAVCQDAFGNANLAATITIPMQSGQVSTGVVTPGIALSPANQTLFTAICPGTAGGLAQVQAFLDGASAAQARAFVWDATVQDFVQVPAAQPTGGWQPFQGVFIATRLPTAFDFNGFMTTFDFTLTLKPGWNFVGIPPLDDSGTAVTTHLWSDLQLEDTSGNIIAGPERVNLIDVGPWSWNGSAYTQVSGALSTGQGYWIDNASSPGVELVLRRLSPAELTALLGAKRPSLSGQGGQGAQSSQDAAATIGYKAHGTPPQPPSGGGQQDSAGHGCGLGSGVGALILGLALLLRLRLRSRR